MKKTKKIIALVLVLVMAIPMLVFPTTTATAADSAVTVTEDFEDMAVGAFASGDTLTGFAQNSSNAPAVTIEEDTDNGKVLRYNATASEQHYILTPTNFTTENYTVTGQFKFSVKDTAGYYGFYLFPCAPNYTDETMVVVSRQNNSPYISHADHSGKAVSAFEYGEWVNFEVVKLDDTSVIRVWSGDNKANAKMWSATLDDVNIGTPGFRLLSFTTGDVSIYLDDLTFTTKADLADTHIVVTEDFNDTTLNISSTSLTSAAAFVSIDNDGDNGVLKYSTGSSAGNFFMWSPFGADKFTISFDLKMSGTSGEPGIYVTPNYMDPNTLNSTYALNFVKWKNSSTVYYGSNDTKLTSDTWYKVSMSRVGGTFSMTVYNKLNPAQVYTFTKDISAYGVNQADTMTFRLYDFVKNADGYTYIDNLSFTNSAENVKYAGIQATATNTDEAKAADTYAIRAIAGIDSLAYADARINVTATYTEGGQTMQKQFNSDKCVAYTKITANTTRGIIEYDASDLDAKYLLALNVYDIPKSVGTVTFFIEVTATDANGITFSDVYTVHTTVGADGSVSTVNGVPSAS